jgi:death on curing protein
MISKETVLRLHELSIIQYGGSQGIRDEGLMESAIARPY